MAKKFYKNTYKHRFNSSQRQHERLMVKHRNCIEKKQGNYDIHFVACNYHSLMIARQKKAKRIYNSNERKSVYNEVVCDFY